VIIAIESASTDVSVAVAAADGSLLMVDGWSAGPRQPHELLPRLLLALQRAGMTLQDADGVAVGTGPGSFTGLRVGMSVAKGLAFALERPLFGVPSLEAWLAAEPEAQGAASRAGAREAYLLIRGERRPRVLDRDQLATAGGRLVAPAELADAFDLGVSVQPLRAAAAVAAAASAHLRANPAGDDLESLEPVYVRAPRGIGLARGEAG
jgi:tRNA threonylcarbamoyl adenosine modification protein YeaZ